MLRRRIIAENQPREENVIYIYSGYLGTGGNVNDEPTQNAALPNAICSSPIFFQTGSVLTVTYDNAQSTAGRMYNTDGSYRTTFYNWEKQSFSIDCYIRLLANNGADISGVKVMQPDGIVIDYKVVDMR